MKRLTVTIALLLAVSACAMTKDTRPAAMCLNAATAYRPVQIAALAALESNKLGDDAVAKIQAVDAKANLAIHTCRDALSSTSADALSTAVLQDASADMAAALEVAP